MPASLSRYAVHALRLPWARSAAHVSPLVWGGALSALGLFLRLFRVEGQSLWLDEGWSSYLAQQPWLDGVLMASGALHPPLYYVVLRLSVLAAGASVFALRFPSVLASTLLVAVAIRLALDLFGRRAALLGAVLLTLAPALVVYGQEARMYALFALLYALLLVIVRRLTARAHPGRGLWASLVLIEAALLWTHLFSAFLLLALNLYGLYRLRRRRPALGRWLVAQALALVLFLPWLPFLWRQAQLARRVGAVGGGGSAPSPALEFAGLVWQFSSGGNLALINHHLWFTRLSLWLGLLVLALLIVVSVQRRLRHGDGFLLYHGLLPLVLIFAVSRFTSWLHPRQVLVLAPPLLVYLGRLGDLLWSRPPLGRPLVAAAALVALLALEGNYFDVAYARDQVRDVAQYLEGEATGRDLIVFDYVDYAFAYHYAGEAPHVFGEQAGLFREWQESGFGRRDAYRPGLPIMPWGEDETLLPALSELLDGRERVFLVTWVQGGSDVRGLLPYLLEAAGRLVEEGPFVGLSVREYVLDGSVAPPPLEAFEARAGALKVEAVGLPKTLEGDGAVPVAVRWRLAAPEARILRIHLRLEDPEGHLVSRREVALVDGERRSTDAWLPGDGVNGYYLLALPAGSAPQRYSVSFQVYDAATLEPLEVLDRRGRPLGPWAKLGQVNLVRPVEEALALYDAGDERDWRPAAVELGPELELVAWSLHPGTIVPGGVVEVGLLWRVGPEPGTASVPVVGLQQDAQPLVVSHESGAMRSHPPLRWAPGELIREYRSLRIPPDALEGPASLVVRLPGRAQALAEVEIRPTERLFTVPQIEHALAVLFPGVGELVGYDLGSAEPAAGEPFDLVLYWRAANGAPLQPYKVFTHLVDPSGRIIAQHDSPPANGARPTPSWVEGEIIIDAHRMEWKVSDYRGPATLIVGLYEPENGPRVPSASGGTEVTLPSELRVGGGAT